MDDMGRACSTHELRTAYKLLFGKPEGKRSLSRPRCKCEENFGMDLREIWREGVEWMHLARDRDKLRSLVKTVVKFRVP
jgi:hypothetical protein